MPKQNQKRMITKIPKQEKELTFSPTLKGRNKNCLPASWEARLDESKKKMFEETVWLMREHGVDESVLHKIIHSIYSVARF